MQVFDRFDDTRSWSEEERILLDQVGRLADEVIAPNAERFDREAAFPWENIEAIRALGLNAIFVPAAYGGAPMSYRAYLECMKLTPGPCAATGIIYGTNFHAMGPVLDFGSEELKSRIMPRVAEGAIASLRSPSPAPDRMRRG